MDAVPISMKVVAEENASPFEGSGTAKDPYQIATKEDLFEMSELVNDSATTATYNSCYYVQTEDIDLDGVSWNPIGTINIPFHGVYDGNYNSIVNLELETEESYAGLFGYCNGNNTIIKNITVYGDITSTQKVCGGIAGEIGKTDKIENSAFIGNINGTTFVGGIVGNMQTGGSISNCYHIGDIQGDAIVGGIAGQVRVGTTSGSKNAHINNCYYAGGNINGTSCIGGIVGKEDVGGVASNTITYDNNYYLTTACSGAVNGELRVGCMNLTEKALKACADMLGSPYVSDEDENLNGGYPVFEWQVVPEKFNGRGTSKDPYQISSAEDLWEMARLINSPYFSKDFRSASYIQTNNIDLKNEKWTPIGSDGYDAPFEGTYDGNQHFITGLNIYDEEHYTGLFATIYGEAVIQDLVVYGCVQSMGDCTGGIVGEIGYGASVIGCAFIGTVNGILDVGGISGKIWDSGAIFDCYSYSEVTGTEFSGGIVGMIQCINGNGTAMLKNCYHVGNVTDEKGRAGGIAGYVEYDEATGNVVTLKNSYYLKGSAEVGFTGDAVIDDCMDIPTNLFKMLAADLGDSYITNPNPSFLEGYPCFTWQTYGDINADLTISVADVVALQKYLLLIETFTQDEFLCADINQDTRVNVFDLCLLKRFCIAIGGVQ